MTAGLGQRWCHACARAEDFGKGWYELWIGGEGECVIRPVGDPADYHKSFRGEIFACGQGSALALAERYLHTGTFDPPAANPNASPLLSNLAQLATHF